MADAPGKGLAEAQALHQAGRLTEAAARYETVLRQKAEDATALALLGALRLQQDDPRAAEKLLRRAADRRPADPTPRYNLGLALNRLGRPADAAATLEQVIAAHPGHADAWKALGDARRAQEDRGGAVAAWRRAIEVHPDHAGALLNLGALLLGEGEAEDAERCLRRLLALRPDDPQALNNLGLVLVALKRMTEAEAAYRRALEITPDHANACENLGTLLLLAQRPEEAARAFATPIANRRAAGGAPSVDALAGLLQARAMTCHWAGQDALATAILARDQEGPDPFMFLGQPIAATRLRKMGAFHGRRIAAGVRPSTRQGTGHEGRIRIGYLSADFREHPVGLLVAEALDAHDRDAFAVHAYATTDAENSQQRARIAAGVEIFRDLHALGDAALAARIAVDELDILVDLGGWTADHRQRSLAMRPAPVQAVWLGYAASVGTPWLDYAILDAIAAPEGADADFSEHLVRLPGCFQPNDRGRAVAPAPSRAAAGLPEQGFVFCAFAQSFKINPAVWDAWMQILAAVPGSVLWLKDHPAPTRANLVREAEARGIAASRLVFAPLLPDHAAHLARYRLAGLALDTWPYGSHTTASDSLWAGCPLVALRGDTLASRISASVLNAAGLAEMIAGTVADFRAIAIRLATNETQLLAMRARTEACRTSPLFDPARLTRHLEAAYRTMHGRHRAGLPPAPITVAAAPRTGG